LSAATIVLAFYFEACYIEYQRQAGPPGTATTKQYKQPRANDCKPLDKTNNIKQEATTMAHKKEKFTEYHPVNAWEITLVIVTIVYFAGHIIAAL